MVVRLKPCESRSLPGASSKPTDPLIGGFFVASIADLQGSADPILRERWRRARWVDSPLDRQPESRLTCRHSRVGGNPAFASDPDRQLTPTSTRPPTDG